MYGLTGEVLFYSLSGAFVNGWKYSGGSVINSISPISEREFINMQLELMSSKTTATKSTREKLQKEAYDSCLMGIPAYAEFCFQIDGYAPSCGYHQTGTTYVNLCGEPGSFGDGGGWGGTTPGGYNPPHPGGGGGTNSGSGGSNGTSSTSVNVPDVEPSESDYRYTCPDNFEFSSVTNNSLWQEGELINIYCNLGIYDYMSGTISNSKTVTIPAVSFGLPYNDVNGGLIHTKNQAKAISADALNMAEEDMRKKYKSNPYLTSGQLADYWVSRMNIRMKELTSSKGKVGRTGSINPAQTPPTKAYNPC